MNETHSLCHDSRSQCGARFRANLQPLGPQRSPQAAPPLLDHAAPGCLAGNTPRKSLSRLGQLLELRKVFGKLSNLTEDLLSFRLRNQIPDQSVERIDSTIW